MRKKLISSFGIVCILTFWVGCSESPAPPPPKAKIIRKKIAALPPDFLQETPTDSSQISGDGGDLIAQNTPDVAQQDQKISGDQTDEPVLSEAQSAPAGETSSSNETQDTSDQTQSISSESDTSLPDQREQAGTSDDPVVSISEIAGEDEPTEYIAYARSERIDPFVPLFKEEPETKEKPEQEKSDGKPKPPPRRLTPLEKLDLSQLKLVGIVRTPRGNKAMVEEASGKGYIIDKGTYIGIHSGQVVEIRKDRIVVEEKDKDSMGKVTVRTREIKFQRPSGDEYYEM